MGDDYFVRNYAGESPSKYVITKAGEKTITNAERGSIAFTADWAANTTVGARFVAVVDGAWYGSDQFGMAADDHGNMNQTEVTDWEVDVSVNADTDNWYASLGGVRNWDTNPIAGGDYQPVILLKSASPGCKLATAIMEPWTISVSPRQMSHIVLVSTQ